MSKPTGIPVGENFVPDTDTIYRLNLTPLLPMGKVALGQRALYALRYVPEAPAPNQWMATRVTREADKDFILMPATTVKNLVLQTLRGGMKVDIIERKPLENLLTHE